MACQRTERACENCGTTFKGAGLRCPACCATERACDNCGGTFKGDKRQCEACRWKSLPLEARQAQTASQNNARRARKLAVEVAGPVPPEVYEAIRASGPCVYCGQQAATVDHVRPLSRGGWERESNLVPACGPCNFSKCAKLLTDWRPERVAYGIAHSPKVAAEYERLTLASVGV
jgi:5-methylcytosine-specific restriction endonuclease McrA